MSPSTLLTLLRACGPGLLMAGAAIGVSHLVQSTRAGADFGFQLVAVVLLINLLKYPFFEYGHRYAVATGHNLLDGYRLLGSGFLYAFLALAAFSAVGSTAGVTFVTAGLAQYFFGTVLSPTIWNVVVMGICVALLAGGHYRALDGTMKLIMAVLAAATITAFVAAVWHGPVAPPDFISPSPWTIAALPFLIALMGWMPAPIEISVFQSLWIQARERQTGRRTTVEEARFDFNFGYGMTTVLAIFFLGLGAMVMHGSGLTLQNSSGGFATQLIEVYQQVLGGWAGPVIALAAFTTMFSTTLTVIDGYPRALAQGTHLLAPKLLGGPDRLYATWMAITCLAALVLITMFASSLTGLIDLVTTLAFLSAPVYGYLNYRLITSSHTPAALRPGMAMRVLSWLGLTFFVGFSVLFVWFRFL
ncbi:MAG: divalent metal cation transporter [Vicinamibacterales bacterium]|nr:divalent metal cation transporter [Vicinamibacterales bacterium]